MISIFLLNILFLFTSKKIFHLTLIQASSEDNVSRKLSTFQHLSTLSFIQFLQNLKRRGKKKDKIERNEQKGIQTRSTLFTKTVHPTVYFTIFHCTLFSLYSPHIKESKVHFFLLPLIYPILKSTKQYGDWKLRNPSLMKCTTLNCNTFFQHFLLISQRIRARACFDCIRSI